MRAWTHVLLLLVALAYPACKPSLSSAPPASALGCASRLSIPRDLTTPGTTLILGELHGTREVAEFAADLGCEVLAQGRKLVLALEIPPTEQQRIDRFLQSSGDAAARAELLKGEYWGFPMQDGRRSQAIVGLLATTQRWVRAGAPVEVVAFDAEVPPAEREAAMAERLAGARRAKPEPVFVVVVGGLHAMRATAPDFTPMAVALEALVKPSRVLSFRLAHAGGSAWLCTEECGPHQLEGRPREARSIAVFDRPKEGFDGEFYVGRINASPPAVEAHNE